MIRLLTWILLIMSIAMILAMIMWNLGNPQLGVLRERVLRTPEQQWAWQEHQQREWEWNKRYANRDFKKCLVKAGYDKCMGRSY